MLLSEIIGLFNKDDMIKNGINNIFENYKDILIDKINNKKITNNEIVKLMNINDKRNSYMYILWMFRNKWKW